MATVYTGSSRQLDWQRQRVNRAVNFLETHLSEPLTLDEVAQSAHASKFHFTRMFHAWTGETPFRFLSRIRLETAARYLAYAPECCVGDVAMTCGFSSPQNFSRAFRDRFQTTPSTFRSSNQWRIDKAMAWACYEPEDGLAAEGGGWGSGDVRTEVLPAYRVAYIRYTGTYFNDSISKFFDRLRKWALARGLLDKAEIMIGLCPDNAALTPAGSCRYDVCIPVDETIQEDNVVSIRTIPAGIYATLHVENKTAHVKQGWRWLTGHWLPNSGASYALNFSYERFGVRGEPRAFDRVDLCMRILPHGAFALNPDLNNTVNTNS